MVNRVNRFKEVVVLGRSLLRCILPKQTMVPLAFSSLAIPIIIGGLIFGFTILSMAEEIEMVGSADEKPITKDVQVIDITKLEQRGEIGPSASQNNSTENSLPTNTNKIEAVRYTLGPDDVIEINVRRHPEFSDKFVINQEGKIQYKYIGDIQVSGMNKKEVEDLLKKILSKFIIEPEVDVTILEYRSKVIYVVGEVGNPGKYYMRADAIPVREAVVQAGLPTLSASMRKTRLIHPDESGRPQYETIDLYRLLYEGDLKLNVEMKPGDVLYVPATLFAKIVRIINPIAAPVSSTETVRRAATGGL